ncbi:MAG: hypothetical protein H6Q90_917 [Deltaproteobacteria bacterium]|nr:hypothetical protein [Deltaproteobacteria bacterium]
MPRVPDLRWGATWLVSFALVCGAVIGLESFVRGRGYAPSIKDDDYAWAWQRTRASGSARTVAVLGASRIQLAFSSEAFREVLPGWRSVQLAIDGTQPVSSLRDLAEDPTFRGIALVEMIEDGFVSANWHRQDAQVAVYHRRWRSPGAMLERWLATAVQSRLALVSAAGTRALGSLVGGRGWPAPPYVITHDDRTQFADFALTDVAALRRRQLARIGIPAASDAAAARAWLDDALALEPLVAAIQARGGNVVYVRIPTCDERWAADELSTPKARFWDQLARRTHAITIHFRDEPTLSGFACPDTSHLASNDGPRFTRAMFEILIARGVIVDP